MKAQFLIVYLVASMLATSPLCAEPAQALLPCQSAKILGDKNTWLQAYHFEDGSQDIAVLQEKNATVEVKRVTFNGAKNTVCGYQSMAIAQGGDWGWHLAWADAQKVYYARMDGEAWVSSVPKKIDAENAQRLRFNLDKNLLTLSWQAADGAYYMQSDDEGRSWNKPTKN